MKVLLLGIGNLLFGDEGIGVHFINYIGKKYRFEGRNTLDIIDGGTLAQRLIPLMVEYDEIIIVDTINAPGVKAGELYFFDFEAIPDAVNWQGSAHEVEMLQTLHMMDLVGDRPKTMIMGVVPTVIEATEFSLSEGVANAVVLMEETLLNYLKSLDIDGLKQNDDVTIDSVLPHSFKSADAYSL
jgi:hydrogenase maturation protease